MTDPIPEFNPVNPPIPEYNSFDPKVIHKLVTSYHYGVFEPGATYKRALYRNKIELTSALAAMENIQTLYPDLPLPPFPVIEDLERPTEEDFVKIEKWLENAFDPHLRIKDRETNEVYWHDNAEEYIDNKYAVLMSEKKLDGPKLSKLLRMEGNTIRWMRTDGNKCRVHNRDLIDFLARYTKQGQGFTEDILKTFAEINKEKQSTGHG